MSNNSDIIIKKAKELSEMIKNHEISIKFNQTLDMMKNDRNALELFEKMANIGRELNEKISNSENRQIGSSSELRLLENELEANPLVKSYILIQKEYMNLLNTVIEKIRGPRDE